jgi:hypothetical protein
VRVTAPFLDGAIRLQIDDLDVADETIVDGPEIQRRAAVFKPNWIVSVPVPPSYWPAVAPLPKSAASNCKNIVIGAAVVAIAVRAAAQDGRCRYHR